VAGAIGPGLELLALAIGVLGFLYAKRVYRKAPILRTFALKIFAIVFCIAAGAGVGVILGGLGRIPGLLAHLVLAVIVTALPRQRTFGVGRDGPKPVIARGIQLSAMTTVCETFE
jgi:hypothetical protein